MALTAATMAEALWIGPGGGQNHYDVGIGQGTTGGNNHENIPQADIVAGYTDPDKFFLNAANNPVFRINAGAGRTSANTQHPRSECREYLQNGTTKAAIDTRSGEHRIQGRSRIIEVTGNRPWICFFQAHGTEGISPNTSDMFRVQTEGTTGTSTNLDVVCRYTLPGQDEVRVELINGSYDLDEWISWEAAFVGGDLFIWFGGVQVLRVNGLGQLGTYWKFGCYLQDNVDKGASATAWGAVEMERGSLVTWHTGYPPPTVPIFTGPDDGLGGGTDTTPPTVPDQIAAIRGDGQATIVWSEAFDANGIANYVLRRDPADSVTTANLGKTDNGTGASTSTASRTTVSKHTAATTGTVIEGRARLWVDSGSASVQMVVHADSAGAPGARLGISDAATVSNTTEAEKVFTFSGANQAAITSGTAYWIGFGWTDPGTPVISWSRGTTASQAQQANTAPANPFGTPNALSGPIDAYVVVETTVTGVGVVAEPTETFYVDTGLTNGETYTYTVSAVDPSDNESAQSVAATVVPGPPDLVAPTTPTNLTAVAGDRQAALSWSPSTDADSGLREYRLYRDGDPVAILDPAVTSYVELELVNGTAYSWHVTAADNSLNESAASNTATATPEAAPITGVPFLTHELGEDAALGVEIAFGADLAADPDTWTWTDVTHHVRRAPGISTSLGRNDESSTSNPAELTLVLDNDSGDYSKGGRSRWWPYVRKNTPVRLRIDPDDGKGGRVVFWGGATGWTPGWQDAPRGRVAVVTLSAAGDLRRLAQGDAPLQSAYRRFAPTLPSIVAYWPMEEGASAEFATAVVPPNGGEMIPYDSFMDWASDSSFACSAPLPRVKDTRTDAYLGPYPNTGQVQVRFLCLMPESVTAVPAGAYLCSVFTTGSVARWDLVYGIVGGSISINAYTSSGSQVVGVNTNLGTLNGKPHRISIELRQVGSNIQWTVSAVEARPGAGVVFPNGTVSGTVGAVTTVQFGANRQLGDTVIGHLTVENAITSAFTATDVLTAFQNEHALYRLIRLCEENGVPLRGYGGRTADPATGNPIEPVRYLSDFERMGPQLIGPLLGLLREIEAADGGQLWDGRSHGLSYTTHTRRTDGVVALTIDAAAGELAGGFEPTDDDQRTRNKVEAKRTHGITATYEDVDGPLGTAVIGRYDSSIDVNIARDVDVIQHAQWQVSLGTADVEGYRYPSVTVDLRAAPHLAGAVLDIVPGDRIDVTGLDDTLAGFTAPTVELIVEGIAHELGPRSWAVTFQCSLFEPWGVGRVAQESGDTSDMVMRLDTDGSTLVSTAAAGATALPVITTGAAWTTNADDYPFMIQVDGLPVRATACTDASSTGAQAAVRARTSGAFDVAATAHEVTLPAFEVGDILLVPFTSDSPTAVHTAGSDWTRAITRPAGGITGSLFWKRATGGDTLTVTTSEPDAGDSVAVVQEVSFRITSTAENSTTDWAANYGYIEDGAGIGDERGYTGGIAGFTSATGDMLEVVQDLQVVNPSHPLCGFLDGLEECAAVGMGPDASDTADAALGSAFIAAWEAAADDPEWQAVQRAYRDRVYWAPAYAAAVADGLSPLGIAIYYDTSINHGPGVASSEDGSFDDIRSRTTGTKPSNGGSEATWLGNFLDVREDVLTEWGDAQVDGRVPAFRQMILDGQFDLDAPITWTMYGDPFTINPLPTVEDPDGGTSEAAQEGTYVALSIANAADLVVIGADGPSGTSGTAPAVGDLLGDYLAVVAVGTDAAATTAQVLTPPSGFGNTTSRNPGVSTSAATFTTERSYPGTSTPITPGTFGLSVAAEWVAFTVAVRSTPRTTQVFTVDPLAVRRNSGAEVQLWRPRRIGMGETITEA